MSDIRDEMVRLYGEGHTVEKIGKMLGVTKNTVMGNLYRLRKKGADLPQRYRSPVAATIDPATLSNADTTGCCFPMWGNEPPTQRFCGAARAGHAHAPYCAEHLAKCYAKPAERERVTPTVWNFNPKHAGAVE